MTYAERQWLHADLARLLAPVLGSREVYRRAVFCELGLPLGLHECVGHGSLREEDGDPKPLTHPDVLDPSSSKFARSAGGSGV